MKDRSRSVYDFGLLMVIILAVALATATGVRMQVLPGGDTSGA